MPRIRPDFMRSPYFIDEPGNWRLRPEAPQALKDEFENYMASLEESNEPASIGGIHIDYPYER